MNFPKVNTTLAGNSSDASPPDTKMTEDAIVWNCSHESNPDSKQNCNSQDINVTERLLQSSTLGLAGCERDRDFNQQDILVNHLVLKLDQLPKSLNAELSESDFRDTPSLTSEDFCSYEEFDYLTIPKKKKASSLKLTKTPPGTPSTKKIVRFADVLGLDLEDVRTFLKKDDPIVPKSVIDTLKNGSEKNADTRFIVACFEQPAISSNFLNIVHCKKISLENVMVIGLTLTGTIRVSNLSFDKIIFVRTTIDDWKHFNDIYATYVPNSSDGVTDTFSFSYTFPSYFNVGNRLQFAACYNVGDTEFWDNNGGNNYIFECFSNFPDHDLDRLFSNF